MLLYLVLIRDVNQLKISKRHRKQQIEYIVTLWENDSKTLLWQTSKLFIY